MEGIDIGSVLESLAVKGGDSIRAEFDIGKLASSSVAEGRMLYTREQVASMLAKVVDRSSLTAVAEELGFSKQYVSDIIYGRRSPGIRLAKRMKLEKVCWYRRTG